MSNTSSDNWSLYASPPSIAAAAIFVAAFAILANITLIRIFKGNRVWFWISVPPLVELAGYACRIYSIQHPQQLPIYIAATAAILIAPQTSAIICYITLPTLLAATSPDLLPLRAEFIAPIFLGTDMIAGALQGTGSGLLGAANETYQVKRALSITLGGIAFQCCIFLAFSGLAFKFYRNLTNDVRYSGDRTVRKAVFALLISCTAHNVRFIYRVVELAVRVAKVSDTNLGTIPEVYEYVFDALFMVIAIGIFALMFPFTIKPDRIYGPIEFLFALGRERRKSRKARKEEGLSSVTLEARY